MAIYKHKALVIATLLGLGMWLVDAALQWTEKFLYYLPVSFLDLVILDIPFEEIVIRSLTLFSFIIFGLFIDRYIANIKQSEEKLKESQRQLRTLASQLLNIQEIERSRIAKDLHDELGQSLMLLKFQLSAVYEKINRESLRQELDPVLVYLEHTIENVRRLTNDLIPSCLEHLGLTAAVRFLIEEFSKGLQIESSLDLEDVDRLVSPQVQLNIYRIFQEALTNIGKHAQAKHLSAVIKKQDDHIYMEIEDDGQGFEMKDVLANSHKARKFGLNTMEERVRLIGGAFNLQSEKDSGTKIMITLPVDEGAADEPLSHFAG
jgi:signal transduction histidine kinase